MVRKHTNRKIQSYLNFGVLLLLVVLINVLGNVYYQRFDLTEEKRYTLSETSKKLAKELKEPVYIKLYLDGEMSARFKRLKLEIRDLILEFREASGEQIELEIIDPLKGLSENEIEEVFQDFVQRGVEPVRDVDKEKGDETRIKYLLPGAELFYGEKQGSINFFAFDVAKTPDENINKAIDNIEYEIANGLRQVSQEKSKRIVVAEGNGEMIGPEVNSFAGELMKYYQISSLNLNFSDPEAARPWAADIEKNPSKADEIFINGLHGRLNLNDLLLIIKPLNDYNDQELYLIDQFMIKGGRVIWLVDPVHMEIDSFRNYKQVLALNRNLENIQSLLFHYGLVLKNTLLADLNCNRIPIPASGQMQLVDFPYFPLLQGSSLEHPISKNIGAVWAQFPAHIEPKIRPNLDIIPLLVSSPYSKIINTPAPIDLESIYTQMRDPEARKTYISGEKIAAILLEGTFPSRYQYMKKYGNLPYLKEGKSKMIVIADADIARNPVDSRGSTYPTGYDKISQFTFANKKFLLNCVDYLIDDNGLIEIRSKERRVRLLDPEKSKQERAYWQWFSMLLPLGLMSFFGLINYFLRLKRYT